MSAFSQVVSIDLRSNCANGIGVTVKPNSTVTNTELVHSLFVIKSINKINYFFFKSIANEINYAKFLNGCLPDDIRVISWAPVANEYSARFDCNRRIYRYYFPK